jgi:hypothetical protein
LQQARDRGKDVGNLFNDPNHHQPPSEQTAELMIGMWKGK